MFELQCLALRKDSKMYKDRIEAILQQMEEVAVERDQVGASRPATGGEPSWRRAMAEVGLLRCETVSTSCHPRGLQPARGGGRSAKWA